jgi:hypothetical protein
MKISIPFTVVNNIKAKTTTFRYKRMIAKRRNKTRMKCMVGYHTLLLQCLQPLKKLGLFEQVLSCHDS